MHRNRLDERVFGIAQENQTCIVQRHKKRFSRLGLKVLCDENLLLNL